MKGNINNKKKKFLLWKQYYYYFDCQKFESVGPLQQQIKLPSTYFQFKKYFFSVTESVRVKSEICDIEIL